MSVNVPTNVKQKEQDINQKLQLYGIVTALSSGKAPSNEQIDVAMNSFKNLSFMTNPSKKLSSEGQALVKEFRDVVEQAQLLILTKNQGNLLQDFIWQTQQIDGSNASLPSAPIDKATAKEHGNQVLEGLRTLGTLIVTNGQFRKLLSDASILLRDIAGDAASKAASSVKPSEEQMQQMDLPAEDNTWHEAPDFDKIKNQIKTTYKENSPLVKKDAADATENPSAPAGVDATSEPEDGIKPLKERTPSRINPEVKDKAKNFANAKKEQAKSYLSEKIPQERRDQTILRMKKMVVEIQSHADYQQAITTLLDLAEQYAGHANNVKEQSVGSVQGARSDVALKAAETDLKTLIERCANGTSTKALFDSIDAIYADAAKDPELKNWFKSIDAYIRKCLQEQGYIVEPAATEEWKKLYDQGNFLLRNRYRSHTDRVVNEFKFFGEQFDKDPLNKSFALSCQKLFKSLGNDENGKPTFKPHLLKDLSDVILPALFENIRYIPVPRIEYSDPMIDAVVENLVIESDNLMPNVVEFASDNYFRWGRKNNPNANKNSLMISVSGVQMDIRDISYYVKKKSGFPSLSDLGVIDIFLGGTGLSFKIKVSTADPSDHQHFFKVEKVTVDVKNFNIKLRKSKLRFIFALSKKIMLLAMRPVLQKVIEKVIKDKFNEADKFVHSVKLEADRSLKDFEEDPKKAPNFYSRFATAAQKKFLEGKKEKPEVPADKPVDKKVNVAMTLHDSILPNVKLPGGISIKATEYKDLAAKGDKWESPVFSIGNASKSAKLPAAPQIVERSHATAPKDIDTKSPAITNGVNGAALTNGFSKQVDEAFTAPTAPVATPIIVN